VSQALGGAGADGPSQDASISGDGSTVAFDSLATNLVPGDTNGAQDVFVRAGTGPVVLVSAAADGGPANGPSSQPDVSADGSRIVFSSQASNLVAGDADGASDVFVRDMRTGQLRRVSVGIDGSEPNGASSAPSISPDGRFVSFFSEASNLVRDDANGRPDVFICDLQTGRIGLVSVSSTGAQQNRAVQAPFEQISDVSAGGRFVAFDSDASNLAPKDTNGHTDVFVRDLRRGITARVSVGVNGAQSDNDSFYPRITPDGRYVAFESFAANLVPGDHRREDIFVVDLSLRATTLVDVTADGRQPGQEHVKQLLERPSLSDDAHVVAFSTTTQLAPEDADGGEDAYVRLTAGPRIGARRVGARYVVTPHGASLFRCQVKQLALLCPRSGRLPRFGRAYTLSVRGGGPGLLFGPPARIRVR
jgi:Tol biopolymer transport system component